MDKEIFSCDGGDTWTIGYNINLRIQDTRHTCM